jgi:aminoglycoside phosphotransferase (APT) family kinase protein
MKEQAQLDGFLRENGLLKPGEKAEWRALTGGVSSEIWRVDLPGRSICVKRALPVLRVAADWRAPVSRNAFEWQWLCFAAKHEPLAVPRPIAHDAARGLFAMSFLAADTYPVWKAQLLEGVVIPHVAAQVGALLGRLHNASANRLDVAKNFDSLSNFHDLRIEPYLLATATRHPDLADRLHLLAARTTRRALALVHGDVSPKNILIGPNGPVLLDAECAWYGDPAFDLAFCLNHLLLKSLLRPDCLADLLESFSQLSNAYFAQSSFEPRAQLERRTAELLPALMLARVDGKSPVEYLVGKNAEGEQVRRVARSLLEGPVSRLHLIQQSWAEGFSPDMKASQPGSRVPEGTIRPIGE